MSAQKRCRHGYHSWFISSDGVIGWDWCYQCGALRRLKQLPNGAYAAVNRWTRPTGDGGKNPWDYFKKGLE